MCCPQSCTLLTPNNKQRSRAQLLQAHERLRKSYTVIDSHQIQGRARACTQRLKSADASSTAQHSRTAGAQHHTLCEPLNINRGPADYAQLLHARERLRKPHNQTSSRPHACLHTDYEVCKCIKHSTAQQYSWCATSHAV
jgi:hypothetical protein